MGQRIGGIVTFKIDGRQYAVKGNFEVMPSKVKRDGIAGQDYVHGFVELPVIPYIKGDLSTTQDLSLEALAAITDATAQADLANGHSYVLTKAWTVGAFPINTATGQVSFECQGELCEEI